MLLVCPNCATSYDVDVASLRPNGRKVRCVRCRTVWKAELPHAEKLIAAAEELAPVRRMVEAMAEVGAEPDAPEPPTRDEAEAASAEAGLAEGDSGSSAAADDAVIPGPPETALEPAAPVEVDSPPIAPAEPDAAEAPFAVEPDTPAPLEDVETVAARRYPQRKRRGILHWPLSGLQSAILGLLIVNAIIVGWRADFVRAMPQTASFYAWLGMPVNLRGLDFEGLAISTEQHEGVPILVIQGNIVNETGKTADVPHLRFAVRNAAHQEIYSWTAVPSSAMLPPGEALPFHSRLASPPPDAHDVLVRFVNRYDILNGNR